MPSEVLVEIGEDVCTLDILNSAAYRLIDVASCQIEKIGETFRCRLLPKGAIGLDNETLRLRFLDHVTDERLRERLAAKTDPVRNLILSLAFGALAAEPENRLK